MVEPPQGPQHAGPGAWRSLPPGFRFCPTDEELVVHYLRRKAFSFPLPANVIPEIDLDKLDPCDLHGEGEEERYFFCLLGGKYSKGSSGGNRATRSGYWRAIGKDKPIISSRCGRLVGMKKVLFHRGKPPLRCRTNWIMHEYHLALPERTNFTHAKEWVVCRVFKTDRAMKMDGGTKKHCAVFTNLRVSRRGGDQEASSSPPVSSLSCVTEISDDGDENNSCSFMPSP